MKPETIASLARFEQTVADINRMQAICSKYAQPALAICRDLDIAKVPRDSHLRVFEVSDREWFNKMNDMGFSTFMGLKLVLK